MKGGLNLLLERMIHHYHRVAQQSVAGCEDDWPRLQSFTLIDKLRQLKSCVLSRATHFLNLNRITIFTTTWSRIGTNNASKVVSHLDCPVSIQIALQNDFGHRIRPIVLKDRW